MIVRHSPVKVAAVAGIVVLSLWTATLLIAPWVFGRPESAGIFGDMFGVVNSLFTGLALVGVAATLWLQRLQLEHQLDAHRQAEARSAEQLKVALEQLAIARNELVMEKERIAREAEPLLIFKPDNRTGRHYVMKFVNRGGAIKHPYVSSGWAKPTLQPQGYIGHNEEGVLSFEDPARPCYFDLEYVRVRDGVKVKDSFVFHPEEMKVTPAPAS